MIKGFFVDTGSIGGVLEHTDNGTIEQIKSEIVKQQTKMTNKFNKIMSVLSNQPNTSTTQPSSPSSAIGSNIGSNKGVRAGTGTIDTTLNNPVYAKHKGW